MDVSVGERGEFGFGPFLLDPVRRRLTHNGVQVRMTPTRFDTLHYLVANAGRVVEKDEALAAIWPGRVIEEANLTQTISQLRRTLQDIEPGAENYIVTAPGRGYRFAESVRQQQPSPHTANATATEALAFGQPPVCQPQPTLRAWPALAAQPALRARAIAAFFAEPAALHVRRVEPSPGTAPATAPDVSAFVQRQAHQPRPTRLALPALFVRPAPRAFAIGAFGAALATLVAWLLLRTPPALFAPPPHSVAVMAFTNLSGDPGQEYFSDGLSEELIDSLGHIGALRVAARTSSFSFKGKAATISDIARQLNVGAVLEGSVRRDRTRLRITVQLVDAASGYEYWSNHYDGDLGDTIRLQEQIARAVATSLQVTLLDADQPLLELGGTSNPKALDAYLRGLEFAYRDPNDADHRALAAFGEAIALDRDYASAHVQRAYVLKDMVEWGSGTDPQGARRMLTDALADTEAAISIAPSLGGAHAARAAILVDRFAFSDAVTAYERARGLAPNDANVQIHDGLFQTYLGHFDSGIVAATRAAALDPASAHIYLSLAEVYYLSRRYNDATDALRHSQQFGDYVASRGMGLTGFIAISMNDAASAVRDCASGRDILEVECLAVAYKKLGRSADSAAVLAKLQEIAGDRGAYNYAEIYAQWGQPANALRWLETAYRLHDVGLMLLKVDPFLDPIRDLPEFKDLERRMNFPA